jgi:hypothetical protein
VLACSFDSQVCTLVQHERSFTDLGPFDLELGFEWHKIHLVMAEMIHFIRQLEAYCRLEVIECLWNVLIDFGLENSARC